MREDLVSEELVKIARMVESVDMNFQLLESVMGAVAKINQGRFTSAVHDLEWALKNSKGDKVLKSAISELKKAIKVEESAYKNKEKVQHAVSLKLTPWNPKVSK